MPLPQMATGRQTRAATVAFREPERLEKLAADIVSKLGPTDQEAFGDGVAAARAAGTFFISQPFHCAVGTVPML